MMQSYEIIHLYQEIKTVAEQTVDTPVTQEALAILTLACVTANCLSNIEQEIEEIRVRV